MRCFKKLKVANDTALRMTMTWMTGNLHQNLYYTFSSGSSYSYCLALFFALTITHKLTVYSQKMTSHLVSITCDALMLQYAEKGLF